MGFRCLFLVPKERLDNSILEVFSLENLQMKWLIIIYSYRLSRPSLSYWFESMVQPIQDALNQQPKYLQYQLLFRVIRSKMPEIINRDSFNMFPRINRFKMSQSNRDSSNMFPRVNEFKMP